MSTIAVGGHTVEVSSPDKIMFPAVRLTKAGLAEYYRRIAEWMLPHVHGRPVAMERYPDGVGEPGFYQKAAAAHFPDYVRRAELGKAGGTTTYVVVDNVETLVYLATQACVTLHTWPSCADRPHDPVELIFDLDPGRAGLAVLRRTARGLRQLLDDLQLPSYPKSTGSSGLHVHVPLDGRSDFEEAQRVARGVAETLVDRDPERVTVAYRKERREGRLFVDTYRNAYAQHAAAPYTLRARPSAPVAAPLDWDEATRSEFDPQAVTVGSVFRRLAQKEDPWADMWQRRVSLEGVADRLSRLLRR